MIYERRKASQILKPVLVNAHDGMQVMIEMHFRGKQQPVTAWTAIDEIDGKIVRKSPGDFERYRDQAEMDRAVREFLADLDPETYMRVKVLIYR